MSLRQIYGELLLKKGTILYHTSNARFRRNPEKSFLFCSFHPTEWSNLEKYITKVCLKRDTSLFFMIESINRFRLQSGIHSLIQKSDSYHPKLITNLFSCYVRELKKEKFDGWFSSIQDRAQVEVALINDPELFQIQETIPFIPNGRNGNSSNGVVSLKDWGTLYPISIRQPQFQPILRINKRYERMIQLYIWNAFESQFPFEYIFHILLHHALINYHTN